MQQAIMTRRRTELRVKRGSIGSSLVVSVEVRRREVLMQNSWHCMEVYFRPGEEEAGVQWLMEELRKDLDAIMDNNHNRTPKMKKARRKTTEDSTPPIEATRAKSSDQAESQAESLEGGSSKKDDLE